MARSRRKTPIFGMTTAESEKAFKAQEHQRERSAVRDVLNGFIVHDPSEENAMIPAPKKFGNPWAGPKDGRRFRKSPAPKNMRK